MGKKNKLNKIEKGTRELIESISSLIKMKDNGPKLKGKGKKVKAIKKTCVHWMAKKGEVIPTVETASDDASKWECKICGAKFPKAPMAEEEMESAINEVIGLVNQFQFWSVKMGGQKEDTAMFVKLKKLLPDLKKTGKNIMKAIQKRAEYENNKDNSDAVNNIMGYFGDYSYNMTK